MLLAAEVTVLLIEHDIGLVMNLSDHCVECSTEWSNPCGGSDGFGAVANKSHGQTERRASGRYGAGELAGLSFSTTSVAMNFNGAAPSFMPT